MKKILIVFGTRPESLKVYPLVYYAKEFPNLKVESYCTLQHEAKYLDFEADYGISKFKESNLPPNNIGAIYDDLDWFLSQKQKEYDYILVQGDTFSALAGALWGYYNKVPVIHVEAGLRTFEEDPFPEEKNRDLIERLSSVWFCPTEQNCQSTPIFKYRRKNTYVVGNTIIDRLRMEMNSLKGLSELERKKSEGFERGVYLCSLHRRESWDRFEGMLSLIKEASDKIKKGFLFLTNPNRKLNKFFKNTGYMKMIEPVNYQEMVKLLINCEAVVTDSGGLIEEAAYLRKPCYILRDYTERQESVLMGLAVLLGREKGILKLSFLSEDNHFWFKKEVECPYGKGDSAKKILTILSREDL